MKKRIIWGVIIVLIASAAVGFWKYQKIGVKIQEAEKILKNIPRNLTSDQEKIYTDKIQKALEYQKTLNPAQANYRIEIINSNTFLAQQYYGLGQLQKAQEYYSEALKLDPKNEQTKIGLAQVLQEGGDAYGAVVLLDEVLEINPKNPDVWLRYMDLRKDLGAASQDIKNLFFRALEKTERHVNIVTKYAQFEEEQKEYAQAIKLWQEAAKAYPENADLYLQEADRLEQLIK